MLLNYWKSAWRSLRKNGFYTVLNVLGLAIGLAVGILIFLWVQDEYSFDGFHRNAANIYKVNTHLDMGGTTQVWSTVPAPVSVLCKASIPEVTAAVRMVPRENQLLLTHGDRKFLETNTAFVDSSFLQIFDFKLLQGNPGNPFPDHHSIVVTRSVARKYFGNENPMGKVLSMGDKENFTVSGVLADFPENSSIRFDILFPMGLYADNFSGNGAWKVMDEDLGNFYYTTFLVIRPGAPIAGVAKKITTLFLDKKGPDGKGISFALQPLRSIHLIDPDGSTGALQTVRIFLIVGILILLIACINYINLSTARSMMRSKEVSVRKIIGAGRRQLFFQFIVESTLLFILSSLLAFIFIDLLLPVYNELSGKQLLFSFTNPDVWLVGGAAIVASLAMSGIYPALLLSSFEPMRALKGKLSMGMGKTSFRKVLVVTQFVFSVGLIITTIVINGQLRYIRNKDLGYDKSFVFTVNIRSGMHDHFDAVRNELLQQPGVLGVSFSDNGIVGEGGSTGDTDWDGKEAGRMFIIHQNGIDERFIPLLKMKMAAGANFTGSKADSAHFILNETAVKQAGINDPIGKSFTFHQTKGTIIGVVKDFNYASLKQAIEPSIFYYEPAGWLMSVRTTGKEAPRAIAAAEKAWKEYDGDFPFDYRFLDQDYDALYKTEQRTAVLFPFFAGVAIIICCLGLFGLATYMAQAKTKEISIRKVLGATVFQITHLLAREFVTLVLIAFLIAAPAAWWFSDKWLQDFAYRIRISWTVFALTALIACAITLITISFQAIKAAVANPVKSLRSE